MFGKNNSECKGMKDMETGHIGPDEPVPDSGRHKTEQLQGKGLPEYSLLHKLLDKTDRLQLAVE